MKTKFKKIKNRKNKSLLKPSIIILFLLFLFSHIPKITFFILILKNLINRMNIFELNKYFVSKENKTETLLIGQKFIYKCLNQPNFTGVYKIKVKPIISSIIPVYNSEKTINYSVCSIQNQNFTNFEIILIDDFSNDNSSKIIKSLQERDERIKILKNKKNMGTLYSRSIGVLISRGEYIFPLDNDDMFFSFDIFDFVLKISKNYDFDVVGFRAFSINNYNDNINNITDLYDYQNYPENIIVYQPELSTWMLNLNGKYFMHDVTIWAKCIKKLIYREATIKLGENRYSNFVSWAEDTIINFVIFTIAKSFIFMHKYGIIHLNSKSTSSFKIHRDIKLFGEIFLADIIYDFSKNNKDKNYAVNAAYHAKRFFRIKNFVNNTSLVYLKALLNKFLKSKYISHRNKIKIKIDFKSFFI